MIDGFVLLAPILLLAIVALLGFVGCQQLFDVSSGGNAISVKHVQTAVKPAPAGTDTITADPLTLQGGELIIATLQWRSGSVQQPAPVLTGADFAPIPGGGPFSWNGMDVQSYFAFNAQGNTSVSAEAVVMGGSNIQWNLCVSAYDNVDPDNPLYSPVQNGPSFVGTNPQTPAINTSQGDMVYAAVFAANNNGTFPGTTLIAAGPSFTDESGGVTNPIVEDGNTGNTVVPQATVSGDPNPRAFIFAVGIKAASA